MNFKKLLNELKIEKVEKGEFEFSSAEKDIISAKHNLDFGDYDWTLAISYNAVLRVSRSFMFSLGYRPIGKEHHKYVFEFLKEAGFDSELIIHFDNVRKRRNKFIYGIIEKVSREYAEYTLSLAEKFVQEIRTFVQEIRTGDLNE